MSTYQDAADRFGTVTVDGHEYALTDQAEYTNRLLPGPYVNYHDASDGEAYDFEMSASAIDAAGDEYLVYWWFEGIKGENDPELDTYDYTVADYVCLR